jgi:hypothetical protein
MKTTASAAQIVTGCVRTKKMGPMFTTRHTNNGAPIRMPIKSSLIKGI